MGDVIHPLTATESEVEAVKIAIQDAIGTKVHRRTARLIAVIRRLLDEFGQFGKLTVRQVYYLLVSRAVIENSPESYRNYVTHLTTGRRADVIPWDAFEDRARAFYQPWKPTYDISDEDDEQEALKNWFRYALNPEVADQYGLCKWSGQPHYVELWVEKDALAGFLTPLCESLSIGLVVSRGYTSYTFKREAQKRFGRAYSDEGKQPVLLYLGDLDPSGYDIFRCLREEIGGDQFQPDQIVRVKRIGLRPEDVHQFGLVPNPIKESDPRTSGFTRLFPELGGNVYELDALPPGELIDRARRAVLSYFDERIEAENQKHVRHWRARFCDYQQQIREVLGKAGLSLET